MAVPAAALRTAPPALERLGRFRVDRVLGKGAQGTVYLAHDTRLEREVALKTLSSGAAPDPAALAALLAEAKSVSRLAHPNIVTLHDAFEAEGLPCLVFEYVPGRNLAELLKAEGAIEGVRAARIAIDVLRGLACAHGAGLVHRDLKPANILITPQGTARIADFGVARPAAMQGEGPGAFSGSPGYMAPEFLASQRPEPSNDVFAAALVLHEALTGRPAVTGRNFFEIANRIAHEDVPAPSTLGVTVDEGLEAVLMKGLARDPARRHANAAAFADALGKWLDPGTGDEAAAAGTLEFILRRMRRKSDFPALSTTVSAINKAVSADKEPLSRLCEGILRDFALTQKLLRLVNAACYTQYGGTISTVSRAVTILGLNGVRDVALALMLLDHLRDRAQADVLKHELGAAYLAGVAAREISKKTHHGAHGAEEVFVCAMFYRLGRLLALFYLEEEFAAVEKLMQARDLDEERASREVLGLSYAELGLGVARKWNLPDTIVAAIRPVDDPREEPALFRNQRNRVIAAMASQLVEAATETDDAERARRIEAVGERFARGMGLAKGEVATLAKEAAHVYVQDAAPLGLAASPVVPILSSRTVREADELAARTDPIAAVTLHETLVQAPDAAHAAAHAALTPAVEADRQAVLAAGVQDITQVLVGEYDLNDVLRIILETMYRAIGFKRVLLYIRDPKARVMRARLGFGDQAASLISEGFSIPIECGRDVFKAAIEKGADLCLEDVDAERIRDYVPPWYRGRAPAHSLILLPILVSGKVLALIAADADRTETVTLSHQDLSLLKTLRNQAILAIRQKG